MKVKTPSFLTWLLGIHSEFREKNILTLTAAVSFYAFLSLLPFLVMVIAASSIFFDEAKVMAGAEEQLRLFPRAVSGFVIDNMRTALKSSGVISLFSFLFLVYLAVKVFIHLEKALRVIFGGGTRQRPLRAQGRAFLFFLGASLLLLLLFLSGNTLLVIATRFEKLPLIKAYYAALAGAVLVEGLFFAVSYKYFAPPSLPFSAALRGGLASAFLLELLKFAFGLYIVRVKTYQLVYGAIGSIVLLMLWLYYSILIYFLGAVVSSRLALKRGRSEGSLTSRGP